MGFYLETSNGEQTYISNSFLKQKLIDYSGATEASSSTNSEIELGFFERTGIPIIRLTSISCVNIILESISPDNIKEMSAVLSLDKIHIIAIAYLMKMGIMSSEDFISFLKADSIYTRDAMLIRYLESDDPTLDFFAGLTRAFSDMPRTGDSKNKSELMLSDVLKKNITNIPGTYATYTGQYFKYSSQPIFKGKTYNEVLNIAANRELNEYVNLINQPNRISFINNIVDKYLGSWPEWVRYMIKGAANILVSGNIVDNITSYFGGWSFTGKLVQMIASVFNDSSVVIESSDVYNEFLKLSAIECAKKKFEERETGKAFTPSESFLTKTFKEAYANVVNRKLSSLSEFWKLTCNVVIDSGYNYLYYSILHANFNAWNGKYDNAEKDSTEKFYSDNKIASAYLSYRDIDTANSDKDGNTVNKTFNLFNEAGITKADIKEDIFDKISNRLPVNSILLQKADNIISMARSNFKMYSQNATLGIDLKYDVQHDIGDLNNAVVLLSDSAPIEGSSWHSITNTGSSNLFGVIQGIIDGAMTTDLQNKKASDINDIQDIVKTIRLLKQNVANSAFNGTNAMVDNSPLLPMAYEIINSYLDFLLLGNAVYAESIKNENVLDSFSDVNNSVEEKVKTLDSYSDLLFTPAVSQEIFNYYRLVYILRESYMLIPNILSNSTEIRKTYAALCMSQFQD